jgi:hypothetical protein
MNKAKNGTIKLGQTVRWRHPEKPDEIFEDGVVVAINPNIEKDDVRVVPLKALFAVPARTAATLEILPEEKEKEARPTKAPPIQPPGEATGKTGEEVEGEGKPAELKTDGPTLEQYLKAGYKAEGYPPQGYAPKDSPGWKKLLAEREAAAKP